MKKREYVGSIFTDVASIIVGDPCKVLQDERLHHVPTKNIKYQDFVHKTCRMPYPSLKGVNKVLLEKLAEEGIDVDVNIEPHSDKTVFGDDAIAFTTLDGCDGWCNVFVERNKSGDITKIIVDLNAKVNPGVDT